MFHVAIDSLRGMFFTQQRYLLCSLTIPYECLLTAPYFGQLWIGSPYYMSVTF